MGNGRNDPDIIPSSGGGHRRRLREKFLQGGLMGFLDYEIIELLLTLGTPRRDCKESAKEALKEFQSFHGVLEASPRDLLRIRGIGPHNVFGLKLVQEVSRRFLKDRMMSRPVCHSSREVFDYLYHSLLFFFINCPRSNRMPKGSCQTKVAPSFMRKTCLSITERIFDLPSRSAAR